MNSPPRKVRAPDLTPMKARGERIVMLTAYDATMARLLDQAGIDILLVGDSVGQVILGRDTTIPVTLDAAGAFAVVVEAVPDAVAEAVTARLQIPTIGIGAGPHCDGQVLVSYDMLGLFDTFVPKFVRQYAQLGELIFDAARNYANDVREGVYQQSAAAAARRNDAPGLVGR